MSEILVCLADNRVVRVPGEIYGCVTVAPLLIKPNNALSKHVFAVRCHGTGLHIAAFVSVHIAHNFAQRLDSQFGDILPKAQRNNFDYCEDEDDKALLDYIDQLADHPTRWYKDRQQMKFRKPVSS